MVSASTAASSPMMTAAANVAMQTFICLCWLRRRVAKEPPFAPTPSASGRALPLAAIGTHARGCRATSSARALSSSSGSLQDVCGAEVPACACTRGTCARRGSRRGRTGLRDFHGSQLPGALDVEDAHELQINELAEEHELMVDGHEYQLDELAGGQLLPADDDVSSLRVP